MKQQQQQQQQQIQGKMQHKKKNPPKKQNLSGCHCHYIVLHPGFGFLKVHAKS